MKAKPTLHRLQNLDGDILYREFIDMSHAYAGYDPAEISGPDMSHSVNRATEIARGKDNYGQDGSGRPWIRWEE